MAIPDNYEICVDWNGDGDFTDTYEDITADIKEMNWQRGKDKQLGSTQAAMLNLRIKPERATKYSPENALSVLAGNLLPYKVVRVRVDVGGAWYTQFYGYIKKIVPHPHWNKNDAYIYCVDGMEQLARAIGNMENIPDLFLGSLSDGSIDSIDAVYMTAHDAPNGDNIDDTANILVISNSWVAPNYLVERAFLFFDTSTLGAGATIISAKLDLYQIRSAEADAGQAILHVVEGIQDDPLALGNFGDHLTKVSSGGNHPESALDDDKYFTILFNSIGKSWINPTGITKLCLRVDGDINSNTPTGSNFYNVSSQERAGLDRMPKLFIYYS